MFSIDGLKSSHPISIMDDALNLAKSGVLDYDTALSVTGYLSKEVEYIPWKASLTGKSSFFATQMFSYSFSCSLPSQ